VPPLPKSGTLLRHSTKHNNHLQEMHQIRPLEVLAAVLKQALTNLEEEVLNSHKS
jgi:hypothetical protein